MDTQEGYICLYDRIIHTTNLLFIQTQQLFYPAACLHETTDISKLRFITFKYFKLANSKVVCKYIQQKVSCTYYYVRNKKKI